MLTSNPDKRLWIQDESGGFAPVARHKDISDRPRGRGLPDWWVVAKDKDWTPPEPQSLLSQGAADHYFGEAGGHTKIGAGHKPQPYDERGRYSGPSGGSITTSGGEIRMNMEGEAEGESDVDDGPKLTGVLYAAKESETATDASGTPDEPRPKRMPEELRMSPQMRRELAGREGYSNVPYDTDSSKTCTIGYGHKLHAGGCTDEDTRRWAGVSRETLENIHEQDVRTAEQAVRRHVTVPVTQGQFDAMTSVAFNAGPTGLARTGIPDLVNHGQEREAAEAFLRNSKSKDGKFSGGLLKRRMGERERFLKF